MVETGVLVGFGETAAIYSQLPLQETRTYTMAALLSTVDEQSLREAGANYPKWVADYYRCEEVSTVDGVVHAVLRVSDPAWVRRIVLGSDGRVRVVEPAWLAEAKRANPRTAFRKLLEQSP